MMQEKIATTMKNFSLRVLIVILMPAVCWGQYYFGQNKVQYTNFNWQVLTTEHFNIYFYPEEEHLAKIGAKLAEDSYTYLVEKFNHIVEKKIPLIVYSSPSYFMQTNVTPSLLPEGVAGFTEYFKERVVVHFHGSYADFAQLIRHELVHVFQMEKIMYVCKSHRKRNPPMPPLWFTEGIAEYWSQGWNEDADMIIRDMVISGNIITFDRLYSISGTYMMYKVGQSILKFMSDTYGDDKLTLLFENWWKEPSFSMIVQQTFGVSLAEIGKNWEYSLKKEYYPYLKDQNLPENVADRLTRQRYNVKPTVFSNISDNGDKRDLIAFKTYRLGYSNIAVMPLAGEREGIKRIIKGQRSARFESLHFIDSKIDANNRGQLTFASKSHESDVLYVYDTSTDNLSGEYRFEGIINISSPAWSPDDSQITFSGTTMNGQTDIYIYNVETAKLRRLTDDYYYDLTPAFSRTGDLVVFSSDRGGAEGINIFSYDLATDKIDQLTFGDYKNLSPKWAFHSDRMLFSSDRNGNANIYMLDNPGRDDRQLVQLTRFATGAFDPVFTPDDSAFVFSGFENQSYNIFTMTIDSARAATEQTVPLAWNDSTAWKADVLEGKSIKGKVKYKSKFSFDIAQSVIAYDAVFGSVGGLQGALTDMLGNHQYYFLVYNTADTRTDFLHSTNAAVTYFNREKRLNWGLGVYRFYNEYNDDFYGYVTEDTYGGLAIASYPFSRFDRVDASLYLRKYYKETLLDRNQPVNANVATGVISYVKDTSIWDPTGPIDGFRMHLSLAGSLNLSQSSYHNSSLNIDIRKYFRLSEASALAVRGIYFASDGIDPQRYYLGGSWDLRGYARHSFYGRNMFLINNELRFPLVDRLYIGFPFGALNFQAIRGALFFDAGKAWEKPEDNHLVGSFGFGARVSLGYITVLRFDFSRKTDFRSVKNGFDFDFFFGWNF